jgi:hypothetical protein
LALRKLAIGILSVATTVRIFHAARPRRRWPRSVVIECLGQPTHDFLGKDIKQDRLVVDDDVVPQGAPFLLSGKVDPDALAPMADVNDWFGTHCRHPVSSTAVDPDL